jgi:phosphatidylglycerophosphate synthase
MPASTPSRSPRRLTLSNALTLLRLLAAPLFFCAIVEEAWATAGLLFWFAVASDVVDGRIARARGEASAFGGVLDHASDATFVVAGQVALVVQTRVPTALPLLVGLAFLQYVFDSRILAGRALRASSLGRWNGIFYFVPPGVIATREMLGLRFPPDSAVWLLGWLLVISTLISMADRLASLVFVRRDDGEPR